MAMDTSAAQWPPQPQVKAVKEQVLKCPRCNSSNTKFCYYNNYSLAQPRYFCKTCRRYWTHGGSLRNIPVGKNKPSFQPNPYSSMGFPMPSLSFPLDGTFQGVPEANGKLLFPFLDFKTNGNWNGVIGGALDHLDY